MATEKHKVEIEVLTEGGEFVSVKVEGGQSIPLPKDAPAPRRLLKDLLAAALDDKHPANRDAESALRAKTEAAKATAEAARTSNTLPPKGG